MMEAATHINDLPDDVLARILWRCAESTTPWKPDSDALWSQHSLSPKPLYLRSIVLEDEDDPSPEEESYPISPPSAIPTAVKIVSSVCRRWRDVAHRDVSTLLVKRKHAISLQELSHAVACFPNLTHLHLSDDSVETLDDTFLAHLASSCPQLKILHVGRWITHHPNSVGPKHKHPITEAGLDRFFQRCTQLEQLSLLCLHRDTELPASFFRLTRLHTLALTAASALEAPDLESLSSLTNLYIACRKLNKEQLSNVRRLPSITSLSLSPWTTISPASGDSGSAAFAIAQLPLIKSLDTHQMLLSDWPLTSLARLQISDCEELERLPDSIAELLPRLRELTVAWCDAFEELPKGFCSLKHLETLSVTKCHQFRCLPENIGRLTALKTLVVEDVPLASLPASICQLSSLKSFFLLSADPIRELPAGFCCLTALTTLCLGRVAHPAGIGRLSNLHTLLLRHSFKDPHLPSSLSEIASLTRLELDNCGVEELPEGVGSLSSLRELHLSSCHQLTALPASVTALTALSHLEHLQLNLAGDAEVLPFALTFLSRLRSLVVANAEKLQRLPADVGSALPQLRELKLVSAGKLTELPASVSALQSLTSLGVYAAPKLASLPPAIGALSRLRELHLIRCEQLEHLPASLTQLTRLNQLSISCCPIRSLCPNAAQFTQLKDLSLSCCAQLEALPGDLGELKALRLLEVSECRHLTDSDGSGLPKSINEVYGLRICAGYFA